MSDKEAAADPSLMVLAPWIDGFMTFCYGPGLCIGKPVAPYNMKYTHNLQFFYFMFLVKIDASWKVKLIPNSL